MIHLVGNIILAFALLQLIVALVNLLFKERLPSTDVSEEMASLSLLIPARDEENNIGHLLGDLISISDRIKEVIVCDDKSTDDTSLIVKQYRH